MTDDGRARDRGVGVDAFTTPVLVVCPRCEATARVVAGPEGQRDGGAGVEVRATCTGCGYARAESVTERRLGGPEDPWLGLPLRLTTPCCGEVLWARNADHLAFLEEWIGARLRERSEPSAASPLRNRRMASRLPSWMLAASNRAAVVAGLARLRALLPQSPRRA